MAIDRLCKHNVREQACWMCAMEPPSPPPPTDILERLETLGRHYPSRTITDAIAEIKRLRGKA
jgi:hypothetical protein